ncbi:hypothetical protein K440DRAFT_618659 [Wilcoxina mikolae CBS 423.85]|nr:hypothetical protein K440DRAFT_618659 [Wilcoxina mikolae CBS 423.85]
MCKRTSFSPSCFPSVCLCLCLASMHLPTTIGLLFPAHHLSTQQKYHPTLLLGVH